MAKCTLQLNQTADKIMTKLSFSKKGKVVSGLNLHLNVCKLLGWHIFPSLVYATVDNVLYEKIKSNKLSTISKVHIAKYQLKAEKI